MYSIADLERISGIKAHTIRIWEKRYELLKPERTPGNHRLYTDQDLLKLLNVEQLISEGYKISNIAEWRRDKIKKKLRQVFFTVEKEMSDVSYYNNEWLQSALEYDEDKFNEIYQQLRSKMSFINLWSEFLVPALQHMGQLWMVEEVAPAEEHFFSQLLRRKILIEFDKLSVPVSSRSPVFLFLPPDEYHELGLLVTDYLLRAYGVYTINLGANVPLKDIKQVLNEYDVEFLVTFIHGIKLNPLFMEFILSLKDQNKAVLLNGLMNEEDVENISGYTHIIPSETIEELEKYISENPKLTS